MYETGINPAGGIGDALDPGCLNDLERAASETCGPDGLCSVILDVVDALVVVLDHEGRIVRFNKACEEATGYSFEELAGTALWDRLLLPEEAGAVEEVFASLNSGDYPNSHENSWVAKDGRSRVIAWSNTAIPNPDGSVRYVIGTGIDITDRRSAEQGVRWRTEDLMLLSTLNESASRGDDMHSISRLIALGTRGNISDHGATLFLIDETRTRLTMQGISLRKGVASQIEKLTGRPLPVTLSMCLADCAPLAQALETSAPTTIAGKEALVEMMRQIVMASDMPAAAGTVVLGLIPAIRKLLDLQVATLVPLVSEGKPVGLLTVSGASELTDIQMGRLSTIARQMAVIVKHRSSEQALRLSEATLAEAQRVARIGNWSWDVLRDERHWSEEIYWILGRSPEDTPPTWASFIDAVHPDDREAVTAAFEKSRRTGRRCSIDHRVVWPDGSVHVARERGEFSLGADGKPARMVGTTQDVTKESRAQKLHGVLLTIAEAVNSSDGLEDLLATIHVELGRLIDTTNFYVALYDESAETYTFPYHVDKFDDTEILGPQCLDKSMTDHVRRRGEATLVDKQLYHDLISAGEIEAIGAPPTAWIGVPLKRSGKDIGVVAVQSYAESSPYTFNDLKLMTFVSDNIAMAVGRKLGEEQISRRLRMEETVSDVASNLMRHSADETNVAIREALASAGSLLEAGRCFMWLSEPWEEDSRDAYEWCADRVSPLIYELAPVVRTCSPWINETISGPGFLRINNPSDIPPEAGALRHFLESAGVGTMLAVPMHDRERTTGLVGVLGCPPGGLCAESVTFLRTLAAALASALERRGTDSELRSSYETLRSVVHGTVDALSRLGEARDPYTAGHQQRVAEIACAIAAEMGFPADRIEGIRVASMLHDIGKIHVPGEILSKPGRLNDIEFGFIRTHPKVGYEILRAVEFPWPVADVAHQHHERLDGSGYPEGLSGEDIIPEARIVAVADVVEAMCTHRPYRPALPPEAAIEELSKNRGSLYGPTAVDACLKLMRTGRLKLGK